MKYLVTGGLGFVGKHLVDELLKNQHEVIIVDNLSNSLRKDNQKTKFFDIDIRDKQKLSLIFDEIDGVFHQASLINVQESIKNPTLYYDVNVNGSKNIFELVQDKQIKVVFASSANVYGEAETVPISEKFPTHPSSPYGETKIETENIAKSLKNFDFVGLRYFNIFGEEQSQEYAGVITKFFENLRKGKPPTIYGDGNQIRDFIYVKDVVNANILAMKSNSNGIFNIGSGKGTTILELATFMINAFNYNFQPIFEPSLQNDIRISVADIKSAEQSFGWKPKWKLFDWIRSQCPNPKSS